MLAEKVTFKTAARGISLILSVCAAGVAIYHRKSPVMTALAVTAAATGLISEFGDILSVAKIGTFFSHLFKSGDDDGWLNIVSTKRPSGGWLSDDTEVTDDSEPNDDDTTDTDSDIEDAAVAVALEEIQSDPSPVIYDDELSKIARGARRKERSAEEIRRTKRKNKVEPYTPEEAKDEMTEVANTEIPDEIVHRAGFIAKIMLDHAHHLAQRGLIPTYDDAPPAPEEDFPKIRNANPIKVGALRSWYMHIDGAAEAHSGVTKKEIQENFAKIVNTGITGLSLLTLATLKFGGFSIDDVTKLVAQKNVLTSEYNSIKDLAYSIARDWFGIELSPAYGFMEAMKEFTVEGNEILALSMQHYYDPANLAKVTKWIAGVDAFVQSARTIKDVNQSPVYTLLLGTYTKIKDSLDLARRNMAMQGHRQEPVVLHLAGDPGVGKTWMSTYIREYISQELNISSAPYNVNLNATGGFFPPYCGEKWCVVDEYLGAVDDGMVTHLNGICSTAPYKIEGASLPEKNQWVNFDFVILMSNVFRINLPMLTPPAEKAHYSRLKTISVRFPGQDADDPRGIAGRRPDCSHLRLDHVEYNEIGGVYELRAATPLSLAEVVTDLMDKYRENKTAYDRRRNVVPGKLPAPTNRVVAAEDMMAVAHAVNTMPFTVHFAGDPGAGKTYASGRCLTGVFSDLYNLPVVRVTEDDFHSTTRKSGPAIYYLDDVISDDNIKYYMAWFDRLDSRSIVWISSNIVVDKRRTLSWKQMPFVTFGVPYPTSKFVVQIKTGTHQGFLRRIGLSGPVGSLDCEASDIPETDSHGIFFKFERRGIVRRITMFRDGDEYPIKDEATLHEMIAIARANHMADSNELCVVHDQPLSGKKMDVVLHAPSLPELKEIVSSSTKLAGKFISNDPNYSVSGAAFAASSYATDAEAWVYTGSLDGPVDFAECAKFYANSMRSAGLRINVSVAAGGSLAEYCDGTLNLIGAANDTAVTTVSTYQLGPSEMMEVRFSDDYLIGFDTQRWLALVDGNTIDEVKWHPPARIAMAIQHLKHLSRTAKDPLLEAKKSNIDRQMTLAAKQHQDSMGGFLFDTIMNHPLLTLLATVLTIGVVIKLIASLFSGSEDDRYVDVVTKLEEKLEKEEQLTKNDKKQARVCLRTLMDEDPKFIRKMPTDFPKLFETVYGGDGHAEVHGHARKAAGSKTMRPEDYDGDLEGLARWSRKNAKNDAEARDIITHVDKFESLGGSAANYITHCRAHNEVPKYSTYDQHRAKAHATSTVEHGNNLPIHDILRSINQSAVIVSRPIRGGGSSRVFGIAVAGNTILTVAHVAAEEGESVDIECDDGDYTTIYSGVVRKISREYELCTIEVTDTAWLARKDITRFFLNHNDDRPTQGAAFRPGTFGRSAQLINTQVYALENLAFATEVNGIKVDYRGHSYTTSLQALSGPLGLGAGDCGTPFICDDPFRNHNVIAGIYIGRIMFQAYFVTINDVILREMMTFAHATAAELEIVDQIEIMDRVVNVDLETKMLLCGTNPRFDFSSDLIGIGGIIGYMDGNYAAERSGEKPCRMSTGLDPRIAPTDKVPVPTSISQVEDVSNLAPVPAGSHANKPNLLYSNARGQFHKKTSVGMEHYDHVRPFAKDRLPSECLNFRRKTLQEVLNGGTIDDPYRTVRGTVDIYTSAGIFYEVRYGMTDKRRFFRGSEINGEFVPDRPLVINTACPEGACLMRRLKYITEAAKRGETIAALAKTFQKRELVTEAKARIGKVRTCESMDFALNLWLAGMLSDFYEMRQHHRYNQHMVIGANFRQEGTWMKRHLQEYNPDEVIAIDVPAWDRNTHADMISSAIKLAFDVARGSTNFTDKESLDNEMKAMMAYYNRPLSVLGDAVYWVDGRMSSGMMFTAQFNTDGHLLMRMAGCNKLYQEQCGEMMPWDLYSYLCREFDYGDDNLNAVKKEGYWLLGPLQQQRIYQMNGYEPTNDRKDGPPCAVPYEDASFCSRYMFDHGMFTFMALKKPTICSFLHWCSNLDREFIASNCRVALEEAIPWGRDFFNQIKEGVIALNNKYGALCHVYPYEVGLLYYSEGVKNQLVGSVETRMMQAIAHSRVDLGAKPIGAIEHHISTPIRREDEMSYNNELAYRTRYIREISRCGNGFRTMAADQRGKFQEIVNVARTNSYTLPTAPKVMENINKIDELAREIVEIGQGLTPHSVPAKKVELSEHEIQLILRLRRLDLEKDDPLVALGLPEAHSSTTLPTDSTAPILEGASGIEIPSEGPMISHSFVQPTTGQPVDMVVMAGSQLSNLEIAQTVFMDTSNTTKSISTQATRGVILEIFPHLDSSKWNQFMKDNARLNTLAAGTVSYQVEMHGPATNGGAVGFVWLPFTPTGTTLDLRNTGQYPKHVMPVGGSRVCEFSTADSKLAPKIRTMDEFLSGVYDKKTTPCIVMYLEMEINNGYNPGTGIQIQAKYVIRSRFGADWYMSRGTPGGAESGGLVGKTLSDIVGDTGLRMKSGGTLAFPTAQLTPRPDAFATGIQISGSTFSSSSTLVLPDTAISSHAYGKGEKVDYHQIYLVTRKVLAGPYVPAQTTYVATYYTALMAARLAPQDAAEVTYINNDGIPLVTFLVDVEGQGQKNVTLKCHRIDCTSDEDGRKYLTTWYVGGYDISWNITRAPDLFITGEAVGAVLNAFLSSATTFIRNNVQLGASLIPPYVVAALDIDAYPAQGGTFIPANTSQSARIVSLLGDRKVAKFVSPNSGLVFFSLISYNGRIFTNAADYQVTIGPIDDFVVANLSDFAFTSTVDVNLIPTERYNTVTRSNETVVINPPLRHYQRLVKECGSRRLMVRADYERILREAAIMDEMDPDEAVLRYLDGEDRDNLSDTIREMINLFDEDELVRMLANFIVSGAVAHSSATAAAVTAGMEGAFGALGGYFNQKRQQKYWAERAAISQQYHLEYMQAKNQAERLAAQQMFQAKNSAQVAQANMNVNNKVIGSSPTSKTTGTSMDQNASTQTGYRRVNPKIGGLTEDVVDPLPPVFSNRQVGVPNQVSSSLPSTPRGSVVSNGPHFAYDAVEVHSQPSTIDSQYGYELQRNTPNSSRTNSERGLETYNSPYNSVASRSSASSRQLMSDSDSTHYSTATPPRSNPVTYSRNPTMEIRSLSSAPSSVSSAGRKASPPTAEAVNHQTMDSITATKVANQRPHPEEAASTNASTRERAAANAANVQRWNQVDSEVVDYNNPEYEALLVK